MATVNFYQSINMSNPRIFYGYVTNATSSSITINDYMGQSGTYNGSFSYSGNNLAGGTVTGYQSVDNYSLSATVIGVSVNALTLKSYLDTGNALGLYQYALSGADQITGSYGSDTLLGFNGNDTINGGNGADNLYGGLGNDTYVVDNAGDVVTETSTLATEIDTVNSSITYTLTTNVEKLTLTGTAALNGTGNALNNTLTGNAAANTLNGGAGNDTILGLAGNDLLTGGNGTDKLTGGAGADTFDFNALIESIKGNTRDSITDFTHSQADKIDLSGIDANIKVAGDQGFTYIAAKAFTGVAGQLDYVKGILAGDTNGDKVADFEIAITLVGATALVSSDFVL